MLFELDLDLQLHHTKLFCVLSVATVQELAVLTLTHSGLRAANVWSKQLANMSSHFRVVLLAAVLLIEIQRHTSTVVIAAKRGQTGIRSAKDTSVCYCVFLWLRSAWEGAMEWLEGVLGKL